jgi:two-component system OmpR family sensor kinase
MVLTLPDAAVMSDIDPDAFGILCRNLVENALRHGAETTPVEVTITRDGHLIVANDGPVQPRDTLDRLTARFERANASADGSGLGLAIVAAIANRIGSPLILESPRPGETSGFQASLRLPTDVRDTFARDAMWRT